MKPTIDYYNSQFQMGDLLLNYGVSAKDFSNEEIKTLRTMLEDYLMSGSAEPLMIDLKTIYLLIQGADEASYLLYAL